jgi:hypothetical protein
MKVYKCSACGEDHDISTEDIITNENSLTYFICKNTNMPVYIVIIEDENIVI